jgi:pimeloyl-ACP methyl ester carboxylesterase
MLPFFFGVTGRELYGVYHPAVAVGHAGRGVVFCSPLAHEAIATQWAYRILGESLARERIHCLRFDYHATGDSAGDSREARIEENARDIAAAIDELKAISGVEAVHLIGIRLGALFALDVARQRADVQGVIAWEPIVDGITYRNELIEATIAEGIGYRNVGGLPIADENLDRIEALSFERALNAVSCEVGVIASPHQSEFGRLESLLDQDRLRCRFEVVEDALPWKADSEVGVAPLPAQATRVIKGWLTGRM